MTWPRIFTATATVPVTAAVAFGTAAVARRPESEAIVTFAVSTALGMAILLGALAVSWRIPGNAIGVVLAWMAVVVTLTAGIDASIASTTAEIKSGGVGPGEIASTAIAFGAGAWTWWFAPIGVLLVIFPAGRAGTRLGRIALFGLPSVAMAFQILAAFGAATLPDPLADVPNPLPTLPGAQAVGVALLPVLLCLLVVAVVDAIRRYRRAVGAIKLQLRWLRLGAAALPATLLLCWLSYAVLGGPDLVGFALLALYAGLPLITVLALFRHDRYDADDAIISTTVYVAMASVLLGVFSLVSIGSGLLIGRDAFGLAVTVTAAVAFALGMGHRRIQRLVGRAMFPARERALRVIAALRARIDAGAGNPEEITAVLAVALRDPGIRIDYAHQGPVSTAPAAPAGGATIAHRTGAATPSTAGLPATPVVLSGVTVAHLIAGDSARRPVPRMVADAAALLIETVRLRAALAQATSEVEQSRERILLAGYEERKRLERDLHDGAQQRLVSLGMSLRLLQRALPGPNPGSGSTRSDPGPASTERISGDLDRAVAEIGTTVAELRLLAQGIRPSSLDDGLHAALGHLASSCAIPLDLEIYDLDLPDQIATTAYFVVSEAVTNAVKHSQAARITIRVHRDGPCLHVAVADNGRGGAQLRPGSGLAGLTDRVAASGGSLAVDSHRGSGTTVRALLPCG